jgi:predicted branched-subunit amino acid permease
VTASVRRRLAIDAVGISASVFAFALVYGLAARDAGLSIVEAMAMSLLVLGGASQFAALGLISQGVPWIGIVVLTAFLNARHLLYAAALAPWLARFSRGARLGAAHVLTDETFALAMPAFQSLGRGDLPTYWLAASFVALAWIVATAAGFVGGQLLPEPEVLGIDVVFPAAMAGLTLALVVDRRTLVAAVLGGAIALAVALAVHPSVGVLAGGLGAPLVAMLVKQSGQPGVSEAS